MRFIAKQFASAHQVFRGTVTNVVDRGYLVEFDVDRTLKGSASRRAKIFTGRGGGGLGSGTRSD